MSVHAGPDIVESGLVLHLDAASSKGYPGTGVVWYDRSGNGHNGTLQNSPIFSPGKFTLDGVNKWVNVSCATSKIRAYNSTTIFVVNLPVYTGGQRCIMSYRVAAGGQMYIGKSSGGIFIFYNNLNNAAYIAGTIPNATTAHCVIMCDADNNLLSLHINGVFVGSVTRTGWISTYHNSVALGFDPGGTNEYMLGDFYQVSHYDRVLTHAEALRNFQAVRGRYGL